jgi:hypothetical protein
MMGLMTATLVTRVLVGGVLLLAAGLKVHELISTPRIDGPVDFRAAAGELALIIAECLLAGWLLSGQQWPAARILAMAWMTALCGVSLYKALSGAGSCGCFGRIEVNPWITVTLDVAALAALIFTTRGNYRDVLPLPRVGLVASQMVLIGAVAMVLRSPIHARAASGSELIDPAMWVNQQPWLLGERIDNWADVSYGKWVVLLYQPDCRECTTTRDNYEILAHQWASERSAVHVALVDTTGEGDPDWETNSAAFHGILHVPGDWNVPTPTLVVLIDGKAMTVGQGFDECQWNDRAFPETR